MAKIHEEVLGIRLSKLVREATDDSQLQIISDDLKANLEAIIQELAGADVIVEIIND